MRSVRLINFGTTDPLRSQAVYHGLAEAMEPGDDPVVDLVTPNDQYVCVGAHQRLDRVINRQAAETAGLPVYRRRVGGGTVLLDSDQLFWHVIFPPDAVPADVGTLFETYLDPVIETFRRIGVDATYEPVNDIVVDGQKITGTGAGTIGDAIALVGSFMFDFDVETMVDITPTPSAAYAETMRRGLENNMTTLSAELDTVPSVPTLVELFTETLAERLDWRLHPSAVTDHEQQAISDAADHLADPAWLNRSGLSTGGHDSRKLTADTRLIVGHQETTGGDLTATVVERAGTVNDIELTGDIQVLSTADLDDVAADLVGTDIDRDALVTTAADSMERNDVVLPGVAADDIASAILDASA